MLELPEYQAIPITLFVIKILPTLVVCISFFIAAYVVNSILLKFADKSPEKKLAFTIVAIFLKYLLLILGFILLLAKLGVDINGVLGGLGITGFAIGFAVKDSFANLLSGILLMLIQPFNLNQEIEVSGYKGKVTAIDLRYTTLEHDDKLILIPNSMLMKEVVIKSRNTHA